MTLNTILHLDMDAFFAAIEALDRPELRGRPVVVGAAPDKRGVVATASYEARKFGIRSAMPSRTAYKLCPHAIFVPPHFERYSEISAQVMAILDEFTPFVEAVSIDEAFMDVQGVLHFWKAPLDLAREMKRRIRDRLQLTASVGIARNKFLAKIASDIKKPDGLFEVPEDDRAVLEFLAPLPVSRIFGVGKVTEEQLHKAGLKNIGDIQRSSEKRLAEILGAAWARHVWSLAHGIDSRDIVLDWEEKSISNETTFDEDVNAPEILRQTLLELAENVGRRLRRAGKLARTADIKVRFADFSTISRQISLPAHFDSDRDILKCAMDLFDKVKLKSPVRLLGVGVSNLAPPGSGPTDQPLLFPELAPELARKRDRQLDQVVDKLRTAYGHGALKRGDWTAGVK